MILARRILSICLTSFTLAIVMPNLGRINRVTHAVYYGWQDFLSLLIVLVPMILILAGIKRSEVMEGVGWTLSCIALLVFLAE